MALYMGREYNGIAKVSLEEMGNIITAQILKSANCFKYVPEISDESERKMDKWISRLFSILGRLCLKHNYILENLEYDLEIYGYIRFEANQQNTPLGVVGTVYLHEDSGGPWKKRPKE